MANERIPPAVVPLVADCLPRWRALHAVMLLPAPRNRSGPVTSLRYQESYWWSAGDRSLEVTEIVAPQGDCIVALFIGELEVAATRGELLMSLNACERAVVAPDAVRTWDTAEVSEAWRSAGATLPSIIVAASECGISGKRFRLLAFCQEDFT